MANNPSWLCEFDTSPNEKYQLQTKKTIEAAWRIDAVLCREVRRKPASAPCLMYHRRITRPQQRPRLLRQPRRRGKCRRHVRHLCCRKPLITSRASSTNLLASAWIERVHGARQLRFDRALAGIVKLSRREHNLSAHEPSNYPELGTIPQVPRQWCRA
jgi:hypothetical protein